MSYLALSVSFDYLCYGSTVIVIFLASFSAGVDFRSSESDVYRRQILTSKVEPRTEKFRQSSF